MLTVADLALQKRDLSDVLDTIVGAQPTFISLFRRKPDAFNQKHEWLEDQIVGRSFAATAAAEGVLTVAAADSAKVRVGTLITLKDDSALFAVTAKTATTITVELASANGSSLTAATLPEAGGAFSIISTPMREASTNDDGEETYHHLGTADNATQILRKEIIISGSALAIKVYGNVTNQLNYQTAFALAELTQDLNRIALFGRRVYPTGVVKGEIGGLYFYGAQAGGLSINANGNRLDSYVINDGAQAVVGTGARPSLILCGPGQARVISNEYKNQLQVIREDKTRGAYVAVIVNEVNGSTMTVMVEPDIPDTHAWIQDPSGFGLSNLAGRGIHDEDATPKGFDGVRRMALGELTLEYKNAKQRLCLIKNLKASAAAIAEIKANVKTVNVAADAVNMDVAAASIATDAVNVATDAVNVTADTVTVNPAE